MKKRALDIATALLAPSLLAASVISAGAAWAQKPLPVADGGFEEADGSSWTASEPSAVFRDSSVRRSGAVSLRLEGGAGRSLTVTGRPMTFAVGRLYRLSAFIRTDHVYADSASRYPTALPACVSLDFFPFTNCSPSVGSTRDFTRVETVFIATSASGSVQLHLGRNGSARGTAWFDDVAVEPISRIEEYIPFEALRFHGKAYRYDDRGWIFVHIEGEPYERGFQFGTLVASELGAYIQKLAIQESPKDPPTGWKSLRLLADATMLRKFDEEYLTEMKGIADGAAKAGTKFDGRAIDLLDVVAVNSVIDIGQMREALGNTPTVLSGKSFLSPDEELAVPERQHKCSAFSATGPATRDGKVVFGQIFMWSGYTGVHFNVICDLKPARGNRIVYQTFPGGIHSGTDFYINSAGLIAGETTVSQTPFDASGTPQSNRIRKALQYGNSIDSFVKIMREKNNGLYTNDWPLADIKTGEAAIYLLGTHADKLWRSSQSPAPFGTPGFLWSNNNPRDPNVRAEYAVQPDEAPHDPVFGPWNRDVAFCSFYEKHKGKIDAASAVALWASSPITRPHACDGKITTSEMAEKLVFLAHQGKVTGREKFPQKDSRRMPDLPGAVPHFTHGFTAFSPIVITEMVEAARERREKLTAHEPLTLDVSAISAHLTVPKDRLWKGTVYPSSDADNWLASGTAAYWRLLNGLPDKQEKAYESLRNQLSEINNRYAYTVSRETDLPAVSASRAYDRYGPYVIPRVKGVFALHQLRLAMGTKEFLAFMRKFHEDFRHKPVTTAAFVEAASKAAGKDVKPLLTAWLDRTGFPAIRVSATRLEAGSAKGWTVKLSTSQPSGGYRLHATVEIETARKRLVLPIEIQPGEGAIELSVSEKPERVTVNGGRDYPVPIENSYQYGSFADEFENTWIVYGTSRQTEANRTLAERLQSTLADGFSDVLAGLAKDSEVSDEGIGKANVILIGSPSDNCLISRLPKSLPVDFGTGTFTFRGKTYASGEDGLFLALPNPANPKKFLFLFAANSVLELHHMTKTYRAGLPSWAVFKGEDVVEQGYFGPEPLTFLD
ncbi:MAG: hypothetical protein IT186_12965 [Acidobacteria bacterium]|nr:hypothetical protein [Acidobacteriota bacterium]